MACTKKDFSPAALIVWRLYTVHIGTLLDVLMLCGGIGTVIVSDVSCLTKCFTPFSILKTYESKDGSLKHIWSQYLK